MKFEKLALIASLLLLAGVSQAQARVTPCNAVTPNDALCVMWTPPTEFTDNTPIAVPLTFRVEHRFGTTGSWTDSQSVTVPRAYFTALAPGVHQFRLYVQCANCIQSDASNVANGTSTAVTPQPKTSVITIAVVISPDAPPTIVEINGSQVYASNP